MRKNKQIGFTLIELLVVLFIGATITVYLINTATDYLNERSGRSQGVEFAEILFSADNRVAIDGLEARYWGTDLMSDGSSISLGDLRDIDNRETYFNDVLTSTDSLVFENVNDFFSTQLFSATHGCSQPAGLGDRTDGNNMTSNSDWVPISDSHPDPDNSFNSRYGMSRCNYWQNNRIPLTLETDTDLDNTRVTVTATNFGGYDIVDTIDFDIDILTAKTTPETMARIFFAIDEAQIKDSRNVAGLHTYNLVDPTQTRGSSAYFLSPAQCLTNDECIIRLSLETQASDGSEYAQVSGRNNFRGNVSFAADPEDRENTDSINSCILWKYEPASNNWIELDEDTGTPETEVECGIRLDLENGDYVVNVAGNSLSAEKSIQIKGECDYTNFLAGGNNYLTDTNMTNDLSTPYGVTDGSFQCGSFTNDAGDKLIVTTDDLYAQNIYAETVNSRNVNVEGGLLMLDDSNLRFRTSDLNVQNESGYNYLRLSDGLEVVTFPSGNKNQNITEINSLLNVKNSVKFTAALNGSTDINEFYVESIATFDRMRNITGSEDESDLATTAAGISNTGTADITQPAKYLTISGTRIMLTNENGTERRGIETFTEDGEVVSKEYVDAVAGVTIKQIIRAVSDGFTVPVPQCIGDNSQARIIVTPISVFGEPNVTSYTATLLKGGGNSDANPEDGDTWRITLSRSEEPIPARPEALQANAIVYCEQP
jgi:prepilin-type N-terminal cleavage/methylation domain-containing protein